MGTIRISSPLMKRDEKIEGDGLKLDINLDFLKQFMAFMENRYC